MTKKHDPEVQKPWVHLSDEGGHLFDQTNGLFQPDDEAERKDGMTDSERIASAAVIMNLTQNIGGGGL